MPRSIRPLIALAAVAVVGAALARPGVAAPPPAGGGTVEADGTVIVPGFRLPPSDYLSDAAKKALPRSAVDQEAPMMQALAARKAGEMRARMPQLIKPRLDRLKAMYKVETRDGTIAGVSATYARPIGGAPAANAKKILLNLPGGGFVMGMAGGTGMMESIPLAGLAGVEIVSITYRQGPEARYPAATEDAVKVYRELLKTHRPQDIAIFGCSAGGALTGQATASIVRQGLPLPAAIGILCASADARWSGDSSHFARPFSGLGPRTGRPVYYEGADLSDPLASPMLAPDLLRRFPPTLLITATRAHDLSGAVSTHNALVKAGATAELHVWDGLGHAFFYDPALPESRDAFDVMAAFFRKYLKLG